MRILCVWGRHNYGDATRGESYEYANFLPALEALGHSVSLFDSWDRSRYASFAELNRALVQSAREARPELILTVLLGYEIWLETLDYLRGLLRCAGAELGHRRFVEVRAILALRRRPCRLLRDHFVAGTGACRAGRLQELAADTMGCERYPARATVPCSSSAVTR